MNSMCPDCRALDADRMATAPHGGLVQSSTVIDLKTRKPQEGRFYICLGCATRWERDGSGWRVRQLA
jgi:hypothetical protein